MNYQTIRYEWVEHVGSLTLARPEKLNAQNPLIWDELIIRPKGFFCTAPDGVTRREQGCL